jgi:RNA polymerase sigma-70 factor (ECF subfamily)
LYTTKSHLTNLVTQWSQIFLAQKPVGGDAAVARNELLVRYHQAVSCYLHAELRDPHVADKLLSNFAVRVLELDAFLKRADPQRGRFRDYLKAVLRRMIIDHYREQQRANRREEVLIVGSDNEPVDDPSPKDEDQDVFLECWRQELINQTWIALGQHQQRTGQPYATLLHLQQNNPKLRSPQLAERLGAELGRPYTAMAVRQLLHRAREMFGKLLVKEVARSLPTSSGEHVPPERIEQELIDLRLYFSYCKAALRGVASSAASG